MYGLLLCALLYPLPDRWERKPIVESVVWVAQGDGYWYAEDWFVSLRLTDKGWIGRDTIDRLGATVPAFVGTWPTIEEAKAAAERHVLVERRR
jgi:hypothetical protein